MEKIFEENKNFAIRFTKDDIDFLNELVPEVIGNDEFKTNRELFFKIIDKASQRTKIKNEEKEQYLNEISNLQKKFDDLLIENLKLIEKPVEVVEKPIEVERKLTENQIIIEFTELEKFLISKVCDSESKRTKKIITPEILLKNMFTSYILKGTHDHFPIPFSNIELVEIFKKYV
jgi:hypothetical protein